MQFSYNKIKIKLYNYMIYSSFKPLYYFTLSFCTIFYRSTSTLLKTIVFNFKTIITLSSNFFNFSLLIIYKL